MRRIFTGFCLAISITGLLTACSSTVPRTTAEVWPLYRPSDFARTSGGRDTYVVLRGNPLALAPGQFEQTVLSNMQGQNWGPRTNFTTKPTNFDNSYKVVMLFNGPNVNNGQLCANPGAVPFRTGPQPELHVQAVYCRYDQMMTASQGWLKPDANGISQEGFARLIRQMTADLFPPFNKDDARHDSDNDHCNGLSC
jgi:hypothetical protein